MRLFIAPLAALGLLAVAGSAAAEYPDRPIRIVAPFAPGGNIDVSSRLVADKLRELLGVTVLVDNKPGASGLIGGEIVARAAPDGYTLLVSSNSMVAVPLLLAPTNWFRKHARNGFDRVRTRNAKLNAFLQEYISGAQTVQLLNA